MSKNINLVKRGRFKNVKILVENIKRKMDTPKRKDTKFSQMQFSAPNSQSWTGEVPRKAKPLQKCPNKAASFQHVSRVVSPNQPERLMFQMADSKNERVVSPNIRRNSRQTPKLERFDAKNNLPKTQGEYSECPLFVFRPLPHKGLQKLTLSASNHLDIKPKLASPQGNRRYVHV